MALALLALVQLRPLPLPLLQARELRIAATKDGEAIEVLSAGEVFKERWVEDAVLNYLQRRVAVGS